MLLARRQLSRQEPKPVRQTRERVQARLYTGVTEYALQNNGTVAHGVQTTCLEVCGWELGQTLVN